MKNKNNTKAKKQNNSLTVLIKKYKKVLMVLILLCILVYVIYMVTDLLKNPTDTFLVEQGQIYEEEVTEGYIIREETVLKGKNYKNGMSQIKTEGERVAKGEAIFRYYSNGENTLVKKIEELDKKIDEAMAKEDNLFSSDTKMLENQITEKLNAVYKESNLQKIKEYKKDIRTYITKKAKIAGELSPSGSYLKKLIDERSKYEKELNSGAEYLTAPRSGVVSYRVDGYEEMFKAKDFGNYTKEFLESLDIKTGQIVAASEESGKIVDNYECYIATILDSDNAKTAEIGEEVKVRLPSGKEVNAELTYMNTQDQSNYVLIFRIEKNVEELIDYRKISFHVIWWSDSGKKVPNSAIGYEQKGDKQVPYVTRIRAGYQDKILVKVLRSNEKYSIVTNYTSEELEELGYTSEEIKARKTISLYDEILLHQ